MLLVLEKTLAFFDHRLVALDTNGGLGETESDDVNLLASEVEDEDLTSIRDLFVFLDNWRHYPIYGPAFHF